MSKEFLAPLKLEIIKESKMYPSAWIRAIIEWFPN